MNDLKINSLNIGQRREIRIGDEVMETGIFKEPVPGPITLESLGFMEDAVVDTKNHGGPDQAVYLYSQQDYLWWSQALGRDLPAGTFGENITLSGFGTTDLKIGDRFQVNRVILEVTFARIPCRILAASMADPGFVKQFAQARRPGVYARVLQTGDLQVGDRVHLLPAIENYPTVIELFDLWLSKDRSPDLLKRGLEAPLSVRARSAFRSWLEDN
jgi:MOSC domain-containing protein YiiM